MNTREFIQLAQRQLTAKMRGLQFAWGLLAAETAFFIPWIAWTVNEQENATARNYIGPYFILAVVALGFGIALISLQRGARRQLKGLRAIQDALDDEN